MEDKKYSRIILTANIIFGLIAIPAIAVVLLYPGFFNDPSTMHRRALFATNFAVVTYSFSTIISYLSWVFYKMERYWIALAICLIPLINIFLSIAG